MVNSELVPVRVTGPVLENLEKASNDNFEESSSDGKGEKSGGSHVSRRRAMLSSSEAKDKH